MAPPKNPEKGYEKFFTKFFERDFKDISKFLQGLGLKPAKVVEVVVDRLRKIENVDKAFYTALVYSSATTFYNALVKHEFDLPGDQLAITQFRESLLKNRKILDYKAEEFDIEKFYSNRAVQNIQDYYEGWLQQMGLEELDIRKVRVHFTDYFKIDFYEFLEESKHRYEHLTDFLNRDSYKARIKLYRREMYYSRLASMYLEPALNDEKGVSLKDLYVEPFFKMQTNCLSEKLIREKGLERSIDNSGFIEFDEEYNLHQYINELFLKNDLLKLDKQETRVLFVLGYPGQGKSSFCKRLMYDWINDGNLQLNQHIYFIKLREVSNPQHLLSDTLEVLRKVAERSKDVDIPERDFQKSWLILDRLDELIMNNGLDDRQVDDLCKQFIQEAKNHPKLRIVLTSRIGYINLESLPREKSHLLVLQLQSFTLDQQLEWLEKYRVYHPETELTEDKLVEFNQKMHHKAIQELLEQPILLNIIASLEKAPDGVETKVQIYEDLFTMLIRREYSKDGQNAIQEGLTEEKLRKAVQDIALKIFHSPYDYVHYHQLKRMAEDEWKVENFEKSLKSLLVSFYFKETTKSDKDDNPENKKNYAIEFLHKSLQEYMAAEKIWRDVQGLSTKKESFFGELFKLFSPQLLSKEIIKDLVGIIKQANENTKSNVRQNFTQYFKDLLRNDFLYKYNYNENGQVLVSPIEQIRNTFYGFWTILSNLDLQVDYLQGFKQKFLKFLEFYGSDLPEVNLSFQNLSHCEFDGIVLHNDTNFTRSTLDFAVLKRSHLRFSKFGTASLIEAKIISCDLSQSRFDYGNLTRAIVNYSNLDGAILAQANLSFASFDGVRFDYAFFDGADLSYALLPNIENFKNARFTETSKILKAYTCDETWIDRFQETTMHKSVGLLDINNYELSPPLTKEEIVNSPNPYLKARNDKPIYQIRLKPGETEG
ncbi:hypothetical protein BKI52_11725 [marine bacterium AO1-C]|nr:hypothetical protein BKI52_11725 [marine bacterium AO1-C]